MPNISQENITFVYYLNNSIVTQDLTFSDYITTDDYLFRYKLPPKSQENPNG